MVFHPKNLIITEGEYVFNGKVSARCHYSLINDTIKAFWHDFSYGFSTLDATPCTEYVFTIGDASPVFVGDCAYSINVSPSGICLSAKNETDLKLAFMTLLDMFTCCALGEHDGIKIECCTLSESPLVENRMVHFCVFPETELWQLRRFVRFCAALKYTHVVVEFWGMLKFDCLKELAWEQAYTKEQIAPVIREANELGLEIIPMFNHWGHATASRHIHGKHVVLDQNPSLQSYFGDDGWCWNIADRKVRDLLKAVRGELMELCGECEYFHIGCDEAYSFEFTEENMGMLCDYINEVTADLLASGRRTIMWGDMLICSRPTFSKNNAYVCLAPSIEAEKFLTSRLDKSIIIADWQYYAPEYPVETAEVFAENGFECMLCPYDSGEKELRAAQATVINKKLKGLLQTTWHTLTRGMWTVLLAAVGCFEQSDEEDLVCARKDAVYITRAAALLRKAMPINGDYEKAGWSKIQVSTKWL